MSVENGPRCMYKLKPIYSNLKEMELPTNMYKLPNICRTADNANDEKNDLLLLEKNQMNLLEKLKSLNAKVMEMKMEIDFEHCEHSDICVQQLCNHTSQHKSMCQDIVINASPNHPPFSVWVLYHLLQKQTNVMFNMHVHSTVTSLPHYLDELRGEESNNLRTSHEIVITIIWKDIGKDPELMVSPIFQTAITSEVNIARYLARLWKPAYDESDPELSTEIDAWLDIAHCSVLHGTAKERQSTLWNVNLHLAEHNFLVGNNMTVADIVMWSALCQTMLTVNLPANVDKWWKNLHSTGAFLLPKRFL